MDNIDLNQSGIYAITSPSGKRYVGSAVNIRKRWWQHRCMLKHDKHHCAALQRAYHKYGGDLMYSVLVLCPKEELIKEEQWYMDSSEGGTLYNAAPRAGSRLGARHTEESRQKIRQRRAMQELLEETRKKLSLAGVGRVHSGDTRAKMSKAHTGRKLKSSSSPYVGVLYHKRQRKWAAQVKIARKTVHLGSYPTAEIANKARQNFDRVLTYYTHSWADLPTKSTT
uniref:Homing endonuclease n=1 Tax=Xanthomonas phage MK21 TaxID=3148942 RepID=A0AAU7J830_9CAUD